MVLPGITKFENDTEETIIQRLKRWMHPQKRRNSEQVVISNNYSILKIAISIGQLLYAVATTLYATRGGQITLFGYAAFGLTVTPYAWMSLVNLLGNASRPDYSTLFLVHTQSLEELQKEIKQDKKSEFPFDGAVGMITEEAKLQALRHNMDLELGVINWALFLVPYMAMLVPIAILGTITRLSPGASQLYQRVWVMTWLVFGTGGALYGRAISPPKRFIRRHSAGFFYMHKTFFQPAHTSLRTSYKFALTPVFSIPVLIAILGYAVPPIGGFVVVGQMIMQYGSCIEI